MPFSSRYMFVRKLLIGEHIRGDTEKIDKPIGRYSHTAMKDSRSIRGVFTNEPQRQPSLREDMGAVAAKFAISAAEQRQCRPWEIAIQETACKLLSN